MHLILTGATGLVGSGVLRAMLLDSSVTRISILSRRPVPQAEGHPKAEVILQKDFSSYDTPPEVASALRNKLASASGVVWALGISQNKVSAKQYEEITHDYAVNFVRFWAGLPLPEETKERTFVYISGSGTSHNPSFMSPRFAVVKGQTEQELLDMTVPPSSQSMEPKAESQPAAKAGAKPAGKDYFPNLTVYAPRPAGVDPANQPDIHEFLPKQDIAMRVLAKSLFPVMRGVSPSMISPTKELGEVCTELAKGKYKEGEVRFEELESAKKRQVDGKGGWKGGVVNNVELRRLGGISC